MTGLAAARRAGREDQSDAASVGRRIVRHVSSWTVNASFPGGCAELMPGRRAKLRGSGGGGGAAPLRSRVIPRAIPQPIAPQMSSAVMLGIRNWMNSWLI
jgi:hypothetical protein